MSDAALYRDLLRLTSPPAEKHAGGALHRVLTQFADQALHHTLQRFSDAALYADLEKYCGGKGSRRPGPCPSGAHNQHITDAAHATAAQAQLAKAQAAHARRPTEATGKALQAAQQAHARASAKAKASALTAQAQGLTHTTALSGSAAKSRMGSWASGKLADGKAINYVPNPTAKGQILVMVDPKKLDADWKQDRNFYLPPEGEGRRGASEIDGRREGFKQFLHSGQPVQASKIVLDKSGSPSFSDGRHRFAVARDLGADRVGVMVDKKQVAEVQRRYGATPSPTRPAAPKPKQAQPWEAGGTPDLGKVYNAPTSALHVDPARFQYKLNTDKSGVTQELKDITHFNPDFAGVISVWKDPGDGKTYVVNGHHRSELARRLGHPDLAVRYIKAGSAKEARAIGALVNIAEGRGTAVDAAKFMRDSGVSPDDLGKHGVSLKGKVAADAAAYANLNDQAFDRVARGTMDPNKALAVAKNLPDHDLQKQLFSLLDKRAEQGKDISTGVIESMAKEMADTPKTKTSTQTLFGNIESEDSLFVPRNELKTHIKGELSKEANDFLVASSKRRAARLGQAGNNVLDTEANARIAKEAQGVKEVFDKLVNRKGPISDAVNKGAEDYAKATTKKARDAIRTKTLGAVRDAVFAEAGLKREGGGTG